jgi:hypothetical protein
MSQERWGEITKSILGRSKVSADDIQGIKDKAEIAWLGLGIALPALAKSVGSALSQAALPMSRQSETGNIATENITKSPLVQETPPQFETPHSVAAPPATYQANIAPQPFFGPSGFFQVGFSPSFQQPNMGLAASYLALEQSAKMLLSAAERLNAVHPASDFSPQQIHWSEKD